jgi:hypothetical protein
MKKRAIVFSTLAFFLLLSLAVQPALAEKVKLRVTAELANIRAKPDIGSAIIRQFPAGATLESTAKEGEWFLVSLERDEWGITSGYVHESLVTYAEPLKKPEKRTPLPKPVETKPTKEKEVKKEEPKEKTVPKPQPSSAEKVRTESRDGQYAFAVKGGMKYSLLGDLNEGVEGLTNYYADTLGGERTGTYSPLHLSYFLGGEIALPLSSRIHLLIGADYFAGKRESLAEYQRSGALGTLLTSLRVSAVPVSFAISYHVLDFIYTRLGVSYYFAKCSYLYNLQQGLTWQEWRGEAKGQGLGLNGGLGLEWEVAPNLALVAEAMGHFGRLSTLSGTGTFQDSQAKEPKSEDGKLYYYLARLGATTYPLIYIREKQPSEGGVVDPRLANLDFSGLTLIIGFKINF